MGDTEHQSKSRDTVLAAYYALAVVSQSYEYMVFVVEPIRFVFKVKLSTVRLMMLRTQDSSVDHVHESLKGAVAKAVSTQLVNDLIVGDAEEPFVPKTVIIRDVPDITALSRVLPKDWNYSALENNSWLTIDG